MSQATPLEVVKLQVSSEFHTYHLGADDVRVLCVALEVRVVHQRIVLQDGLPLFVIFAVSAWLARELLNRYLV